MMMMTTKLMIILQDTNSLNESKVGLGIKVNPQAYRIHAANKFSYFLFNISLIFLYCHDNDLYHNHQTKRSKPRSNVAPINLMLLDRHFAITQEY